MKNRSWNPTGDLNEPYLHGKIYDGRGVLVGTSHCFFTRIADEAVRLSQELIKSRGHSKIIICSGGRVVATVLPDTQKKS